MQKGFGTLYIVVGVLLVAALVGGVYYFGKTSQPPSQTDTYQLPVSQTSQPVYSPSPNSQTQSSADDNADWKTFNTSGIDTGLTLKYPSNWVIQEGMFISEKTFVAGEQDRSKVYNIIEIQKNSTQLYEGYTNSEWFTKINNLVLPDSDQRETRTKLISGKVASGESYVIFKSEPSATAQGGAFKQVKAYILKDQTIYQLTLDLYDNNGLEVSKKIVASATVK